MGLIFPRLAQNFVKDGYFPTDSETLKRVCGAIDPELDQGMVRIIDPCCGEGSALIEIEDYIKASGRQVNSFGIEINEERAWHAKNLLNQVAHANIEHVWVSQRSCGLLFLNPPYGDMIRDKGDINSDDQVKRFEAHFVLKTVDWVQPEGLMVLIVPHYIVNEAFATLIASYYTNLSIWLAPEQQFKQCVIFGVKRRKKVQANRQEVNSLVTMDKTLEVLPEHWTRPRYTLPAFNSDAASKFTFKIVELDRQQLAAELNLQVTLWSQYRTHFAIRGHDGIRPLMPMSKWHVALALVSGQINGIVHGDTGQKFLVKGSTHKYKQKSVVVSNDGKREDTIMVDRFEPRIVGFNLTPGQAFGSVVRIVNKLTTVEDDVGTEMEACHESD